jgi:hypothetical protein
MREHVRTPFDRHVMYSLTLSPLSSMPLSQAPFHLFLRTVPLTLLSAAGLRFSNGYTVWHLSTDISFPLTLTPKLE